MQLHDIVGTIGVALIVVTYAGVQLRKMEVTSLTYSGLNLLGALMILLSLAYNFNLASVVIEVFWIIISLWSIVVWIKTRKDTPEN